MTQHIVDVDGDFHLLPTDAAEWLLVWLEHHGASVTLNAEHDLKVSLDGIRHLDADHADRLARTILQLRHELRQLLLDREAVVH